jgi:hypothetical protein
MDCTSAFAAIRLYTSLLAPGLLSCSFTFWISERFIVQIQRSSITKVLTKMQGTYLALHPAADHTVKIVCNGRSAPASPDTETSRRINNTIVGITIAISIFLICGTYLAAIALPPSKYI